MDIHITKFGTVIIDGKIKGSFEEIQKEIKENNPNLIRKFKMKSRYLGGGDLRYIADWDSIMKEYYK